MNLNDPDIGWSKLLPAAAGTAISMRFVKGTKWERLSMAIGGLALSYYGTTPAANFVGMGSAEGLVGFVIGMFGMSLAAKVYETIGAIDAKQLAADLTGWLGRFRKKD
jgi:hypothetical protein